MLDTQHALISLSRGDLCGCFVKANSFCTLTSSPGYMPHVDVCRRSDDRLEQVDEESTNCHRPFCRGKGEKRMLVRKLPLLQGLLVLISGTSSASFR